MKRRICAVLLALCLTIGPMSAAFAAPEDALPAPPAAAATAESAQPLPQEQETEQEPSPAPTEQPPTPIPTEPAADPEPTAEPAGTSPQPAQPTTPETAEEPKAEEPQQPAPLPAEDREPATPETAQQIATPETAQAEPAVQDSMTITWNRLPNPEYNQKSSINFYLNLYSNIANYTGSSGGTGAENFTESVSSGKLNTHPDQFAYEGGGDQYIVLQGSDSGSAFGVDAEIRTLQTDLLGFQYSSFPSDSAVFQLIRSNWRYYTKGKGIKIDNVSVSQSELTTDAYTIRWYVFKYNPSDAWHVDGILVPKSGTLTVTKTFTGLTEEQLAAMESAENPFGITVEGNYHGVPNQYALQFRPYTPLDAAARPGYRSRAAQNSSVTYTWQVDVYNSAYRIREQNTSVQGYRLAASWRKQEAGAAATAEAPYTDEGFTVNCVTTAGDETAAVQSAMLYNRYTRRLGSLTLQKRVTGVADEDAAQYAAVRYAMTLTAADKTLNGRYGGLDFADGIAALTLGAGQQLQLDGLPEGAYTIAETTPADLESYYFDAVYYTAGTVTGATATVTDGAAAALTVTNHYEPYRMVTVTKQVQGTAAETDRAFAFTAILPGNKTQEFTLTHGQSETITGLRDGETVTVTETETPGYTTVYRVEGGTEQQGSSARLQAGQSVTFTNTAQSVPPTGVSVRTGIGPLLAAALAAAVTARRKRSPANKSQ